MTDPERSEVSLACQKGPAVSQPHVTGSSLRPEQASMSTARSWRDQGEVQQVRELLAPVYGWFTEGFDTRDLKEAKALLEELAA